MAEPAGLQERVTRLETQMVEVRYLASKAEREGGELGAVINGQVGILNALRETQVEQGMKLDSVTAEMRAGFARVDAKFERVDANFEQINVNFAQMHAKFGVLKAGQDRITELLGGHLDGGAGE